jgi:hypothetical protein
MRGSQHGNARHTDLILTLARLGNIEFGQYRKGLHTHQRVHLHSKGFLDAERHIPGGVRLAIEQTGRETRNAFAAANSGGMGIHARSGPEQMVDSDDRIAHFGSIGEIHRDMRIGFSNCLAIARKGLMQRFTQR